MAPKLVVNNVQDGQTTLLRKIMRKMLREFLPDKLDKSNST